MMFMLASGPMESNQNTLKHLEQQELLKIPNSLFYVPILEIVSSFQIPIKSLIRWLNRLFSRQQVS